MENNHLMLTDRTTDTISEAFPLLHNTLERRPYQAYCTTEASSCPSSPDQFVPSPLRVAKVHSHQIDVATQALHIDSSEQGNSFNSDRNAKESAEKHLNLSESVPKKEYNGNARQGMTRKALLHNVSSVTSDQIAPLNIRKGGHSLAEGEVAVYNQISSSAQLQPPRYVDGATKHKTTHKPMPYNEGSATTNRCPDPRVFDLGSPTSHRNSHGSSLKNFIPLKARPRSALYLSTNIQNGPRPPPWGSDDNLALQRRIRSELRDRAHILASDTVPTSTPNYKKLSSPGHMTKGLSREVEEYRQQILNVYPDMTLDGNAGEDKGGCSCCVVM